MNLLKLVNFLIFFLTGTVVIIFAAFVIILLGAEIENFIHPKPFMDGISMPYTPPED